MRQRRLFPELWEEGENARVPGNRDGLKYQDEARALEERAPIPGGWGQTFFITKNLGSMESVAKDTE